MDSSKNEVNSIQLVRKEKEHGKVKIVSDGWHFVCREHKELISQHKLPNTNSIRYRLFKAR